ncbi:MAG: histidine phosphatase family protein, partial [Raineya sp.]|nr:histidine phosphatase family protein [Raineya sp.]
MKILYLLRHAKSSWKEPELSDFERPLNRRGKKDAPAMGAFLKAKNIRLELIVSSPAKRA